MAIMDRFKDAWNAFIGRDPTFTFPSGAYASSFRPDKLRGFSSAEKVFVDPLYNQIAVDCASININHVRLDENDRYVETIKDDLNTALTLDANVDQTGRELIKEAVMSMLKDGHVVIVPIRANKDIKSSDSYKIYELRVGKILEWFPRHLRVELYDEDTGQIRQVVLEKRICATIENPFYETMNETNGTLQRLRRILSQIDKINTTISAGKIDLIVQLPYPIRSADRKKLAEERVRNIELQLSGSQYGIAYADSTEKIIQLNRSLENNLWTQAKDLQEELYSKLGFSKTIFDGTADEKTMLNYNNRTIEPILSALTENMEKKWITKTARSQGQAIRFFRDPFKLVPVSQIAEIADKFTRNEIMTSNEIRSVIGMKPSSDPKADQLINANLNQSNNAQRRQTEEIPVYEEY